MSKLLLGLLLVACLFDSEMIPTFVLVAIMVIGGKLLFRALMKSIDDSYHL